MLRSIISSLFLSGLTLVLCSIVYPALLWVAGRTVFRAEAEGTLVRDKEGTVIGSRLIAQPFSGDEYFHPRPSAANYDASAASGSNLAPSNPALRKRVAEDPTLANLQPGQKVPADLVTTSGSGLDPHITLDGARFQVARVAKAWAEKTGLPEATVREQLETILRHNAAAPLWGLAGAPLVNVLEVNLAVRDQLGPLVKK